jgi:hypothetical protein
MADTTSASANGGSLDSFKGSKVSRASVSHTMTDGADSTIVNSVSEGDSLFSQRHDDPGDGSPA